MGAHGTLMTTQRDLEWWYHSRSASFIKFVLLPLVKIGKIITNPIFPLLLLLFVFFFGNIGVTRPWEQWHFVRIESKPTAKVSCR